jgi:hypothetical protein
VAAGTGLSETIYIANLSHENADLNLTKLALPSLLNNAHIAASVAASLAQTRNPYRGICRAARAGPHQFQVALGESDPSNLSPATMVYQWHNKPRRLPCLADPAVTLDLLR